MVIIIMQLFSANVYQPSYSTTHFFIIRKSGFKKLMVFQAKYGNILWSHIQYKFMTLSQSSGVNMKEFSKRKPSHALNSTKPSRS